MAELMAEFSLFLIGPCLTSSTKCHQNLSEFLSSPFNKNSLTQNVTFFIAYFLAEIIICSCSYHNRYSQDCLLESRALMPSALLHAECLMLV